MTDWDTWAEIRATASRLHDLEPLDSSRANRIAQSFAERYVADPASRWWWDSLRPEVEADVVGYDEAEAWDVIERRAPRLETYVLLVTDEEPIPAGAVGGPMSALRTLVAESPYFEYLLTDENASFGIFDTHHNTLVALGLPAR